MITKVLLVLSVVANISLGGLLVASSSDEFKKIVAAAESIKDSHRRVVQAVDKFNVAVRNIERVTKKIDYGLVSVDASIRKAQSKIDDLEYLLRF